MGPTKIFVSVPSPTLRVRLSSNQRPTPTPAPPLMLFRLFHQTEPPLPPSTILPPTSPYLATKTLYHHKLLGSSFNLQHYLPSNAKLNFLNLLTPNPPFSFLQQIVSQLIQDIFLISSPKKKETIINRLNRRNNTHESDE